MPGKWWLHNLDTGDEMQGQFEVEELNEGGRGSTYVERWSLNRDSPIMQFIHGRTPTIAFRSRFYLNRSPFISGINIDPAAQINVLKKWAERDVKLRRPPFLMFWVGDSNVNLPNCILESVSDIQYHDFEKTSGKIKHVSFTISLREYVEYDLEVDVGTGETRYHHSKSTDYYELLCQREYEKPNHGIVIRDRTPDKMYLVTGDVVKLPSFKAIADIKIQPTSIALKTAFGAKQTPQKELHQDVVNNRDTVYYSHIL